MGHENAKAYTEQTKAKARNDDLKSQLENCPVAQALMGICDTVIVLKPVTKRKK